MINSTSIQGYAQSYSVLQSFGIGLKQTGNSGQGSLVTSLFSKTDTISLGGSSTAAVTYTKSAAAPQAKSDGYEMLRGLVLNMLKEQGIDNNIVTDGGTVDISSISREDAQKLVAQDGYFGVEQTSDRIVNFAKGISGGDPSRIDAIKKGVDKGFKEALKAFGGQLPDISYATYDAVMNKLDTWAQQGNDNQASLTTG